WVEEKNDDVAVGRRIVSGISADRLNLCRPLSRVAVVLDVSHCHFVQFGRKLDADDSLEGQVRREQQDPALSRSQVHEGELFVGERQAGKNLPEDRYFGWKVGMALSRIVHRLARRLRRVHVKPLVKAQLFHLGDALLQCSFKASLAQGGRDLVRDRGDGRNTHKAPKRNFPSGNNARSRGVSFQPESTAGKHQTLPESSAPAASYLRAGHARRWPVPYYLLRSGSRRSASAARPQRSTSRCRWTAPAGRSPKYSRTGKNSQFPATRS